jgi:hypothetical protein
MSREEREMRRLQLTNADLVQYQLNLRTRIKRANNDLLHSFRSFS